MSDAQARLDLVYQARTSTQLKEAYQAWATHYDEDLVGTLGWDKPERVGEVLRRHCGPDASVLDVGAGTGLVGAYLAAQGYQQLSALDYSHEMLEQARSRGVYRELIRHDMHVPIPLPDDSYEAVISVGMFTEGHVGPNCLADLGRVARRLVVFSLRDDLLEEMGFQSELERLGWPLVERARFDDGLGGRAWSAWVYSLSEPGGPP